MHIPRNSEKYICIDWYYPVAVTVKTRGFWVGNWTHWILAILDYSSQSSYLTPTLCSSLRTHWVFSVRYPSPVFRYRLPKSDVLFLGFLNCLRATATATLDSQWNFSETASSCHCCVHASPWKRVKVHFHISYEIMQSNTGSFNEQSSWKLFNKHKICGA
jgi:hypothetical protein